MGRLSHHRARDLLQVDRHADADEIRRAYRRAARRHHPDAGGDAAVFRELVAALDLLLDDADRADGVAASPSTGRRAYPSTTGQYAHAGTEPADHVDLSLLDDALPPDTGQRWSPSGVAAAVVGAYDTSGPDRIRGVSRRPGSVLNRLARHLSDDLLSQWEVTGASRRGVAGRDLEVVATFPPGGRRRIDRAALPPGWSTTRNPGGTESTFVIRPGGSEQATAVLVAGALEAFCASMDWPLDDWRRAD